MPFPVKDFLIGLNPPGNTAGDWTRLDRWIAFDPQSPALPGVQPSCVKLQLVRSSREREPNVLVATIGRWLAYASTAPELRLKRLVFAVAADGRVLVRGTPLPPMPGARYVEQEHIAIPCGFELRPT